MTVVTDVTDTSTLPILNPKKIVEKRRGIYWGNTYPFTCLSVTPVTNKLVYYPCFGTHLNHSIYIERKMEVRKPTYGGFLRVLEDSYLEKYVNRAFFHRERKSINQAWEIFLNPMGKRLSIPLI
jgi:hypothetical protein